MSDLVSVCVISYNSEKTILATLDSVRCQTYSNIELIVSDDCSTDNTFEIVQKWISENSGRFVATKVLTVEKNTGVTANCNRAYRAASGVWIKDIGADDSLLSSCISDCMEYLSQHSEIEVVFTKLRFVNPDGDTILDKKVDYDYFDLSAKEQFTRMVHKHVPAIPTPGVFYKKSLMERIGYFDERIPMWEDGPMYFILAKNNVKLYLFDKEEVTVLLRDDSISNSVSFAHRRSISLFYFYYLFKYEVMINPIKAFYHFFKFILLYFFK